MLVQDEDSDTETSSKPVVSQPEPKTSTGATWDPNVDPWEQPAPATYPTSTSSSALPTEKTGLNSDFDQLNYQSWE